jgi:hypothetical protein
LLGTAQSVFQTQHFEISMPKNEQAQVTPERLTQFGSAYAPPLIIGAAVANKVFDILASGPRSVDELSRETGASTRGLRDHERAGRPRIAGEI